MWRFSSSVLSVVFAVAMAVPLFAPPSDPWGPADVSDVIAGEKVASPATASSTVSDAPPFPATENTEAPTRTAPANDASKNDNTKDYFSGLPLELIDLIIANMPGTFEDTKRAAKSLSRVSRTFYAWYQGSQCRAFFALVPSGGMLTRSQAEIFPKTVKGSLKGPLLLRMECSSNNHEFYRNTISSLPLEVSRNVRDLQVDHVGGMVVNWRQWTHLKALTVYERDNSENKDCLPISVGKNGQTPTCLTPGLEVLHINARADLVPHMAHLKVMTNLRELSLTCHRKAELSLFDETNQWLDSFREMKALHTLHLAHFRMPPDINAWQSFVTLPLKVLTLTKIYFRQVGSLSELSKGLVCMERLESLTIDNLVRRGKKMVCLSAHVFQKMKALHKLRLTCFELENPEKLSKCKQITELDASYVSQLELAHLSGLSLKRLTLDQNWDRRLSSPSWLKAGDNKYGRDLSPLGKLTVEALVLTNIYSHTLVLPMSLRKLSIVDGEIPQTMYEGASFPPLTHLTIERIPIDASFNKMLTSLRTLKVLALEDIKGTGLTLDLDQQDELRHLTLDTKKVKTKREHPFPCLHNLNVYVECYLGKVPIERTAFLLTKVPHIETLHISWADYGNRDDPFDAQSVLTFLEEQSGKQPLKKLKCLTIQKDYAHPYRIKPSSEYRTYELPPFQGLPQLPCVTVEGKCFEIKRKRPAAQRSEKTPPLPEGDKDAGKDGTAS